MGENGVECKHGWAQFISAAKGAVSQGEMRRSEEETAPNQQTDEREKHDLCTTR